MGNFKKECVRGLCRYPTSPCQSAIKKIQTLPQYALGEDGFISNIDTSSLVDVDAVKPCPWYVIDKKSNYCFFKWNSNDINKKEHTLEHISLLLGTSTANIHSCLNRTLKKSLLKFQDQN